MRKYIIGDAIKFACEETGLKLSKIANASGITIEDLRNMKLGRIAATESQIRKLESVLGLSLQSRAILAEQHIPARQNCVLAKLGSAFESFIGLFRGK